MSEREYAAGILLRAAGIYPPCAENKETLRRFIEEELLWGRRIHTVGKKDIKRSLREQVLDSIDLLAFASEALSGRGNDSTGKDEPFRGWDGMRVADIGTGFGFPGVVWKIAQPAMAMTLFERKEKAALFLDRICRKLGLDGTEIEHGDAGAAEVTGGFGLAVSKASGRLSYLLPIVERLLVSGGTYITIKQSGWRREMEGAAADRFELTASRRAAGGRGELLAFKAIAAE